MNDTSTARIKNYLVLADQGYSFEQIRTDTALRFVASGTLRHTQRNSFWLRVILANQLHYSQLYSLWVGPDIFNTLYYFNPDGQQWVVREAGITAPSDKSRETGNLPFVLQAKSVDTLFIKMQLPAYLQQPANLRPKIFITSQAVADKEDQFILVVWVASLTALLLFFLNNLYIYYSFRDKTVLYYLAMQAGAAIYITAYRQYFNCLLPGKIFMVGFQKGNIFYYSPNSIFMHLSVMVILYGFVQLARSYLDTQKKLPTFDKLLKYGMYTYQACSLLLIITNVFIVFVDEYVLLYQNILVLLLVVGILATSVVAHLRKLPMAGPFLVANLLPLAFMLCTALYHVFVSFSNTENSILPDLAIISQALSFSIVLVARMKAIRNKLATTEQQAHQLAFDIREIELQHRLIEQENARIEDEMLQEKSKNDWLQQKLETNQRELASNALYTVQKGELLSKLKAEIAELKRLYPARTHHQLAGMEKILETSLDLDEDWEKFKVHFEKADIGFFENLIAKHPNLTKNDMRLYAYFHSNLSTKEIAAILGIAPASVRQAKMRLYKKLGSKAIPGNHGDPEED